MTLHQGRPQDHFPSGDSRALLELALDPAHFAERDGVAFEEGFDDLDWYQRAAIALPDGSQAWLVKDRGERGVGTTVYGDAAADPAETSDVLLATLGLHERDVAWTAPGVALETGTR